MNRSPRSVVTVASTAAMPDSPSAQPDSRCGGLISKKPLAQDQLGHEAIVAYLSGITTRNDATGDTVQVLVRQLLPSGTAKLKSVAGQLGLHPPKTLQRRLADEHTTFAAITDGGVRRELADRLLRDTGVTLAHLAHELGYAEQSVLTRSCQRWFGCPPGSIGKRLPRRRNCIPADKGRVTTCWNAIPAGGRSEGGEGELDDLADDGRELVRQGSAVVGHAVALTDLPNLRRDLRVPVGRDVGGTGGARSGSSGCRSRCGRACRR